jgi:hypothetical protein
LSKGVKVVEANEKIFASAIRQAQRPNEKALFVKAFRGSKDGYLFFLDKGIFFGFKKPLLFLAKDKIASVAYTSILQRTFNLVVEVYGTGEISSAGGAEVPEKTEYEFSMVDQEDFDGIDGFVKRNSLMDGSLAEARRARVYEVNKVKNENGETVGTEEAGELAKAGLGADTEMEAPELGDEDDEESEGEDYDPGSEGDSEGEGSSSDEDSGEEGEDAEDDDDEEDEEEEGGDQEEDL